MIRKELIEKFCGVLNKANLGPFEETIYSEMVFIDEIEDKEIETLIRELEKLG